MLCILTAIVGIDACFEFSGTQQAVWFQDGPLPMAPLWFNRVEPRTFARQRADDNAHAPAPLLDPLMVLAEPVSHRVAAVPRGVVPDQQQGREALCRQLGRAPRQEVD